MGFFIVAILQTEKAFKELELDLQLKYKAQYRCSISAGLISESMLKASQSLLLSRKAMAKLPADFNERRSRP